MNLFQETINDIKNDYDKNPNQLGWRFLVTSKKTLEKNNGILFITLNPGGEEDRKDHPNESCENGCAYITESWSNKEKPGASKLQKQYQLLFKEIAHKLNVADYINVLEKSVCGYFIPFRSSGIETLKEKNECIIFSKKIWKNILANQKFKVIICIDKDTYKALNEILCEMHYKSINETEFETGWGNYKSSIRKYNKNNEIITLLRFPHLSRYSIFGRNESKKFIEKIMVEAFKDYNN